MSLSYDCSDKEERADGLIAAAAAIERGELVVLPTDTVYGLAADAFSPEAVGALFDAKGRGRNVPSPVLVGSWNGLDGLVLSVSGDARELVEAFWPGGLTIIVEHAPSLSWDLGDTRGTVAVRMPAHPLAIDLLTRTGPLAVSSANKHGQPAPSTAAHARKQLGDAVTVYLEADVADGRASSIVDLTGEKPVLRRAGAISVEQLREVLPDLVVPAEKPAKAAEPVTSPADDAAETPVADAETPVDNAETPVENTETPVENTETTVADAETSVADAETPVENAETPVEHAETPVESAETSATDTVAEPTDAAVDTADKPNTEA